MTRFKHRVKFLSAVSGLVAMAGSVMAQITVVNTGSLVSPGTFSSTNSTTYKGNYLRLGSRYSFHTILYGYGWYANAGTARTFGLIPAASPYRVPALITAAPPTPPARTTSTPPAALAARVASSARTTSSPSTAETRTCAATPGSRPTTPWAP